MREGGREREREREKGGKGEGERGKRRERERGRKREKSQERNFSPGVLGGSAARTPQLLTSHLKKDPSA